ncbi:MAG: hypothetical protein O6700_02220 [Gammaproteobacteria bacterium]|nr:hypothetical protein [Gammaproteobacteria bacterium]TDJ47303.1 MAG: hypothetical protein E2O51_01200 [Gammaproteobacteria bacterium]
MTEIKSASMRSAYRLGEDFKLDTMDIVVAVLLGVIQAVIEIVGLLGFLERAVWATGPIGFVIYAFYNGTTWILFYAGVYLRKRAMVVILAVGVTALVRWFAGDPDGPVLMFYGLFPATCGATMIALLRWRGGQLLFALAVAVTAVANQCAMFIGQGGFQLVNGTTWALISMSVAALGGLLWGVLAWHLGRALENAGVPSLDRPPALGGGRGEHA